METQTEKVKVKVPPHIADAWAAMIAAPPPAFTERVTGHADRLPVKRRLLALCFELADRRRFGRFYLGGHIAAALTGTNQSGVSKWLREFCRLGFIRLNRRGSSWTGTNQYAWAMRTPADAAAE